MSLHVASLDQPGAQQVQREVARAGADLERARVAARPRAAERLAHLRQHLVVPELAEVDAPLGVVVVGRDVVVARVDVADLLGAEQSVALGGTIYSRAVIRPQSALRAARPAGRRAAAAR